MNRHPLAATVRVAWQPPPAPASLPRYPAAPSTDDRSTVRPGAPS